MSICSSLRGSYPRLPFLLRPFPDLGVRIADARLRERIPVNADAPFPEPSQASGDRRMIGATRLANPMAARYIESMRRFKWIEWNLQKIAAHGLFAEEVEAAFDRVYQLDERRDGSFRILTEVPSGRRIWVIRRYDRDDEQVPDVFGEVDEVSVFVITAY